MAFLVSPGVNTSEIDLTASVPAVGTSTGATVGVFRWGPANTIVSISDETQLASVFGKPDSGNNAVSFLSAANFLSYGNDLRVVRVLPTPAGGKAYSAVGSSNTTIQAGVTNGTTNSVMTIANDVDYFNTQYAAANASYMFAARYPGALGNSLKVDVCANTAAFSGWAYATYFDAAPKTSNWATSRNKSAANDEMHIVVVDQDGLFTGTPNTVLERYSSLSKASDARSDDGNSIYYKEHIYRNSRYIHWLGHPEVATAANVWGQTTSALDYQFALPSVISMSLNAGTDGVQSTGDVISALDLFKDTEKSDISLLFLGDACAAANVGTADTSWFTTVAQAALTISDTRKDCVTFISPPHEAAVSNTGSAVTNITSFRNGLTSTSYGVMDSGWKYQYDKYNDVYRWVPLNADVAGLCVRTDQTRDPWFSPAGFQRGQVRNVIKLSLNPKQAQRDDLYKAGVNPVVSFPGEGTVLFGDKTLQGRPSAFDRINVRRLFIVLEKAISRAAKAQLFEFNDEFTRAQFVNLVDPFLRSVKGRRGIFDYRVVCDTTNNTPQVVDANQFVGDIYIKPARSINFIQLNFVAVRTGVSFDEVVGKF